jgi:hypothetical protein
MDWMLNFAADHSIPSPSHMRATVSFAMMMEVLVALALMEQVLILLQNGGPKAARQLMEIKTMNA